MKYCVLKIIRMFTLSDRSTEQTVKVHFMTQGEMTILKIYFLVILWYTNHVLANKECNPGEYTGKDTLIIHSRAYGKFNFSDHVSLLTGKTACFQILPQNKNITEAKEYCASRNMTLAPFVKNKNHGTMKDWIRYLFHLHPRS